MLVLLACGLLAVVCRHSAAQNVPIYKKEAFDRVTLTGQHGNAVLITKPLDLLNRVVPADPLPDSTLKMELVAKPGKTFEVFWADIAEVELFEDLILVEAEALSKAGKFDEAYGHFQYMLSTHPDRATLQDSLIQYLTNNALASFKADQFDDALSLLDEAYRLSPQGASLNSAIKRVMGESIMSYAGQRNYRAVRQIVDRAESRYEGAQHELVSTWRKRLAGHAQPRLNAAQAAFDSGDFRKAHIAAREMLEIWPDIEGGRALSAAIAREYPLVMVGVTQVAHAADPTSLDDWAARRIGRLRQRLLFEFSGYTSGGGEYPCPWGTHSQSENGRTLSIELRRPVGGGTTLLTGFDVARQLLQMANPGTDQYRATWAELTTGVSVTDVFRIDADLRRGHVRPGALLQVPLSVGGATDSDPTGSSVTSPFLAPEIEEERWHFVANSEYFMAEPGQVKEVEERRFNKSEEAAAALLKGTIDMVDRLAPTDLPRLQNSPDITVARYIIPTVHALVFSDRKALIANTVFRRALLYGIDRQVILQDYVLGGKRLEGAQLLSGPFPAGFLLNDPLGYAQDPTLDPRPYDPLMSLALASLARSEVTSLALKNGQPPPDFSPLVLAHQADRRVHQICEVLAEYWKSVNIECTLLELPPSGSGESPEYDVRYVELVITEPLIDAARLFDSQGIAGAGSPFLTHAIRQVNQAQNWREARDYLHDAHRIVHDELALIPLWQLPEFFAYRKKIRGISARPAHLYQDIERWRVVAGSG